MTPDERSLLQNFLQDLVQTRGQGKDPEADSMIQNALRSSPDAAYVLVQHAIMSDQALHAAQARIAELQSQLSAASAPRAGFLPQTPAQPSPWSQPAPQPMPQPAPQAASYYGPGPFSGGGGLGSFLRNAGTTAAGVAGGALLFEGISGLFGGHGGGGFGGFGGGGYGGTTVETVTNNYYDDNSGGGGDFGGDSGGWDDSGSDDS